MIVLRIGIKIDSVTYEKLISKKHDHNFLTQIKFDFFFQPRVGEEEEKLKLSQPVITRFLQVLFFFRPSNDIPLPRCPRVFGCKPTVFRGKNLYLR